MSDDQLKQYLPKYGDRLALRGFASKMKTQNSSFHRKQSILDRLRCKLEQKPSEKQMTSTETLQPKNAEKIVKKVGIGLMMYDFSTKSYIQVRTRCGGGTKNVIMSKLAKKRILWKKAVKSSFQMTCHHDMEMRMTLNLTLWTTKVYF